MSRMGDNSEPPTKRMRLPYHHKHKIHARAQDLPNHEPTLLPSTAVDKLLIDSIKVICEEEGLKQGIETLVIESVALESLRNAAEEFTLQLCSKVRRSMTAARRAVPIAPDFDTAFDVLDVKRPDDQIYTYQTKPTINPPLLPTPPPDDQFHNHVELPASFLGPELSRQDDLKRFAFNTASLPPLPSAHTYKDSAVYVSRETDSRKIREMATEEGKLGEQALRKLATAVKLDSILSSEPEARMVRMKRGPRGRRHVLTEEAAFEATMRDLIHAGDEEFDMGPVVTSEKSYRMPDDSRIKRRSAAAKSGVTQSGAGGDSGANKYNLLPPPLKKKSISAQPVDPMDIGL